MSRWPYDEGMHEPFDEDPFDGPDNSQVDPQGYQTVYSERGVNYAVTAKVGIELRWIKVPYRWLHRQSGIEGQSAIWVAPHTDTAPLFKWWNRTGKWIYWTADAEESAIESKSTEESTSNH